MYRYHDEDHANAFAGHCTCNNSSVTGGENRLNYLSGRTILRRYLSTPEPDTYGDSVLIH